MVRIKPVLPSFREKKRYLAFEVISEKPITNPRLIATAINSSIAEILGGVALSRAGVIFLSEKFDVDKQVGLIKVNNRYLSQLRAALAVIKRVGDRKAMIRSLGASGILKKADER
ncbi:ribonuclease P, partial [Candidatus Woesearchaeota archaeon]|nr:ribonuclease P [Candidatus Woesearchaeota archaeon]